MGILKSTLLALSLCCGVSLTAQTPPTVSQPPLAGEQRDVGFRKVILDADLQKADGTREDTIEDPMELAVAKDGRVFYAQRNGSIKMWKPDTKATVEIAKVPVFKGNEDGMLGIALDPDFLKNGWIFLNHSVPETTQDASGQDVGVIRVSRFTLVGNTLDLTSEKTVIDIPELRGKACCHVGGSLAFDAKGNLYIAIGDNTNPFESDGRSPSDERVGRAPWDAQKSSSNMNDLRGGVSRIHPEPNGTYTIPKGNLFPPGTPGTRPEVFGKGGRNVFRISVDQRSGTLYWGDVGPDAGDQDPKRGPAGFDAIIQVKKAGFFGWPYSRGDNRTYARYDFTAAEVYVKAKAEYEKAKAAHALAVKEAKNVGTVTLAAPVAPKPPAPYVPLETVFFSAEHPVNNSPNNTGIKNLPPTQPAFIWYPGGTSTKFPAVNGGGGRTAMAGPIYYFDPENKSETKLPKEYDHTLFIYEWSRNWIVAVHLDENEQIAKNADGSLKMERFCPKMTFKRPMDLELGPDGCLYLIEYGTAWGNNKDTQIVRLDYVGK